jgi:hypothetical protein
VLVDRELRLRSTDALFFDLGDEAAADSFFALFRACRDGLFASLPDEGVLLGDFPGLFLEVLRRDSEFVCGLTVGDLGESLTFSGLAGDDASTNNGDAAGSTDELRGGGVDAGGCGGATTTASGCEDISS